MFEMPTCWNDDRMYFLNDYVETRKINVAVPFVQVQYVLYKDHLSPQSTNQSSVLLSVVVCPKMH